MVLMIHARRLASGSGSASPGLLSGQLLARVQQHQLARTVQNELRASKQPDAAWNWDERRFHLAPVTGHSKRVVPIGAWAEFIRKGGDPAPVGGLDVVPDVLAERHLPSMSGMQYAW